MCPNVPTKTKPNDPKESLDPPTHRGPGWISKASGCWCWSESWAEVAAHAVVLINSRHPLAISAVGFWLFLSFVRFVGWAWSDRRVSVFFCFQQGFGLGFWLALSLIATLQHLKKNPPTFLLPLACPFHPSPSNISKIECHQLIIE